MALTKSTYTQAASLTYQDVTISPVTLTDGTMRQRFDTLAFPQKGIKYAGSDGPTIPPPVLSVGAAGAGGTFAAATYFWKLTVLDAKGESLPSNEVSLVLALNATAPLSWAAGVGATGYKLYRGTVAGAENVLVTTLGAVTTYTDTGTAGTAATVPLTDTSGWPVPAPARTTHGVGS
jgi:hypothetical protein